MVVNAEYPDVGQTPFACAMLARCSRRVPMPEPASVPVVKATLAVVLGFEPLGGVIDVPVGAVLSATSVKVEVPEG